MRRMHLLSLLVAAAVILVFAGCQTTKSVTSEQSMIKANASGFAPASQTGSTAMGFALSFGNSSLVKSWTVQVIGAAGMVKTFSGDGKSLPATLSWDGKNDSGSLVPGGTFTASLAVDYGGKLPKGSAVTDAFVADMTPPTSVLTVSPAQITPSAQGLASPITLTVEATSLEAKVSGWTIKILDSNGTLFQTFDGTWPDHTVTWDGQGTAGQYVQPSMTYSAEATVRDSYGLASVARASVLVAAAAAQEQMPQASVPYRPGCHPGQPERLLAEEPDRAQGHPALPDVRQPVRRSFLDRDAGQLGPGKAEGLHRRGGQPPVQPCLER